MSVCALIICFLGMLKMCPEGQMLPSITLNVVHHLTVSKGWESHQIISMTESHKLPLTLLPPIHTQPSCCLSTYSWLCVPFFPFLGFLTWVLQLVPAL